LDETVTFTFSRKMVKEERTEKRDLRYSKWHRTLGNPYYMMDLDCVEWRSGRGVVAIIEKAIRTHDQLLQELIKNKEWEMKVMLEIATKLEIPAYVVYHEKDLSQFYVLEVKNSEQKPTWRVMAKEEYSEFIRTL